MNKVLKFPARLPNSIVGGNMKIVRVTKISKKSLEKLNSLGYTVIIV